MQRESPIPKQKIFSLNLVNFFRVFWRPLSSIIRCSESMKLELQLSLSNSLSSSSKSRNYNILSEASARFRDCRAPKTYQRKFDCLLSRIRVTIREITTMEKNKNRKRVKILTMYLFVSFTSAWRPNISIREAPIIPFSKLASSLSNIVLFWPVLISDIGICYTYWIRLGIKRMKLWYIVES